MSKSVPDLEGNNEKRQCIWLGGPELSLMGVGVMHDAPIHTVYMFSDCSIR